MLIMKAPGVQRSGRMRRAGGALLGAVLLGTTGASVVSPVQADEPPASRSVASPRTRDVVTARRVVADTMAPTPVVQLVPPCVASLMAPLLECIPPAAYVVPPHDGAVRNALHGAPPKGPKPYPMLFSW